MRRILLISCLHSLYNRYIAYKVFLFSNPIMRYLQFVHIFSNMRSCNISHDILNVSSHSLRITYHKIHQSRRQQQQNHYRLHTNFRIVAKFSGAVPLVEMSAFCRRVLTLTGVMTLHLTQWYLKKWYLTPMCLIHGVNFTSLDVSSAPFFLKDGRLDYCSFVATKLHFSVYF